MEPVHALPGYIPDDHPFYFYHMPDPILHGTLSYEIETIYLYTSKRLRLSESLFFHAAPFYIFGIVFVTELFLRTKKETVTSTTFRNGFPYFQYLIVFLFRNVIGGFYSKFPAIYVKYYSRYIIFAFYLTQSFKYLFPNIYFLYVLLYISSSNVVLFLSTV